MTGLPTMSRKLPTLNVGLPRGDATFSDDGEDRSSKQAEPLGDLLHRERTRIEPDRLVGLLRGGHRQPHRDTAHRDPPAHGERG